MVCCVVATSIECLKSDALWANQEGPQLRGDC
jgi:hypothetical protein